MAFFKDQNNREAQRIRLFPLTEFSICFGACLLLFAVAPAAAESPKSPGKLTWIPASKPKPISGDRGAPPTPLKVIFKNQRDQPVKLHWFRPRDRKQIFYQTIRPGGKRAEKTYRGAVWIITDPSKEVLGYFKVTYFSGDAIIPPETDEPAESPRTFENDTPQACFERYREAYLKGKLATQFEELTPETRYQLFGPAYQVAHSRTSREGRKKLAEIQQSYGIDERPPENDTLARKAFESTRNPEQYLKELDEVTSRYDEPDAKNKEVLASIRTAKLENVRIDKNQAEAKLVFADGTSTELKFVRIGERWHLNGPF